MGIKHKAVKRHGERGYASEWNDDHIIDGNVDFEKHQAKNLVVDLVTEFPSDPAKGQIVFRSDEKRLCTYDGTEWKRHTTLEERGIRTATKVIAANDSADKDKADYVCDGSHDEMQIIQAINDLPSCGGRILLLEGTYNIEGTININKDRVVIEGQGVCTVLKTTHDIHFFVINNRQEITIRNMKLYIPVYVEERGIIISNTNHLVIEKIWIDGGGAGPIIRIYPDTVRNAIIKDIICITGDLDLFCVNVRNMLISGITTYAPCEDFPYITIRSGCYNAITNCRVQNIDIMDYAHHCSVTNCIAGYILDRGTNNAFAGNVIT